MSKVVREDLGNQNVLLTVTIDRESYEPKFNETLKGYKQKVQQKGFRKGKTPMSFLKKMYGQSVLVDVVNNMMQEQLVDYLTENDADFIGQPIPNAGQEQLDFDYKKMPDFEFKFDIGLMPQFDMKGLDGKKELELYKVEVPDATVDEEWENARKRTGERVLDEEKILAGDMVKFAAKELDGDAINMEGIQHEFSMLYDTIADEAVKKELLTKKKGDTIRFNVFELEKDQDEKAVKRYLLGLTEEEAETRAVNPMFEGEIIEVSRVNLAEVNEDFLKQFKENEAAETPTAAAAREFIRNKIGEQFVKSTEALLFRDMQDLLVEENKAAVTLPDDYMKRWLVATNEENTPELVEKEYHQFADQMRWTLMRNKLIEKYGVKVEQEDVRQAFADQISMYMGGQADATMMAGIVDRMMENREQVEKIANEVATDKLFDHIKGDMKVKEKPVSVDEFQEIVRKINEENAAQQAAANEEE